MWHNIYIWRPDEMDIGQLKSELLSQTICYCLCGRFIIIFVWNYQLLLIFWLSPKPTKIGEWIVGDLGYHNGSQFVIPKQSGPCWLHEMTSMATACHKTINSRMKVWAVRHTSYQHGPDLHEWLLCHEQTTKVIANVINIWLMESLHFLFNMMIVATFDKHCFLLHSGS
jgi:hypothetical protein